MLNSLFSIAIIKDLNNIIHLIDAPLKLRAFFVFSFIITQSFLELLFILSLTWLGMAITCPADLRNLILYKILFYIIPYLSTYTENSLNLLMMTSIIVVIICAIKNIFNFFCTKSIVLLSEHISCFISDQILKKYLNMDYAWHLSAKGRGVFQAMMWRANVGRQLQLILSIYAYLLTIIVLCFSLLGQEPALSSLVLGLTGTCGILLYVTIRNKIDYNAKIVAKNNASENRIILFATRGIREVVIHGNQNIIRENFLTAVRNGIFARFFSSISQIIPVWILETIGFASVSIAIAFLIYIQNADTARITAALSLLILTAWRVLPFCNRIVGYQIAIRALSPMVSTVLRTLNELQRIRCEEISNPDSNFIFSSELSLDKITFYYGDSKFPALSDVSFTICKGNKIGIIGLSGAGKTTLAWTLCGLLPPTSGCILLDGKPMSTAERAALSLHIGLVPQNPFLFAGTLAENVAFADYGKPIDEHRVREACRLAAVDFVDSHPKGLFRPISENGKNLSGGQIQRIAIARALYTKPDILVFDEATSSLDEANENIIRQTINSVSPNVTCIIIAHRLSTVEQCDKIVWMKSGRIAMHDDAKTVLNAYKKAMTAIKSI